MSGYDYDFLTSGIIADSDGQAASVGILDHGPVNFPGIENLQDILKKDQPGTLGPVEPVSNDSALHVRTSDGKTFRVYLQTRMSFGTEYINRLVRFLDSRTKEHRVIMMLGVKIPDDCDTIVGSIVAALIRCQAHIETRAVGYCSFPETMIWCYGETRSMYEYSALSFGFSRSARYMLKTFGEHFQSWMKKAIELGVITEDDVKTILEENKEKMVLAREYNKASHDTSKPSRYFNVNDFK